MEARELGEDPSCQVVNRAYVRTVNSSRLARLLSAQGRWERGVEIAGALLSVAPITVALNPSFGRSDGARC